MIEAQEIKHITSTPPGVTIPVRIIPTKHLQRRTYISPIMMIRQRTPPDPPPIQARIPSHHLYNILSLTPFPNTPTTIPRLTTNVIRPHPLHPVYLLTHLHRHHHPLHPRRGPYTTLRYCLTNR